MKRVVTDKHDNYVLLQEVDADNIYVFKGYSDIYKAHRIEDDKFAFISLADSKCWANGIYNSLEKLIENTLLGDDEVLEFEDFDEFVDWLSNEV
jgi:ferredoxin-fold anticodon binding domain-containing protein